MMPTFLVEQKSVGPDLDAAYEQAGAYCRDPTLTGRSAVW